MYNVYRVDIKDGNSNPKPDISANSWTKSAESAIHNLKGGFGLSFCMSSSSFVWLFCDLLNGTARQT